MLNDLEDPKKISDLTNQIEWSQKKLKPFHEQDVRLTRKLVGKHYGEEGSSDNRPVNLIELGSNILLRNVTSTNTQTLVDSRDEELLPGALDLQLVLNNEIARMEFDDSCNDTALQALIRMGIMEVGLTTKDTPPDGKGNLHDPGHVFADNVPFTETILDMRAKRWEQMRFVGHEYQVPFDWLQANSGFDKKSLAQIKAPESPFSDGETDMQSVSMGNGAERNEYDDTITLRQIFRFRERDIVTLVKGHQELVLQRTPWLGPERGPYHRLFFGKVPENLIPLAPIPLWHDLDDVVNRVFNQVADQAERQKTILGVPNSNVADGQKVVAARDGDAVGMDDPTKCQEFKFGGATQESMAFIIWAKQLWDYMAGNITALGGLGAMSRTVGQDQMIAGASGGRVDDMQARMMAFKGQVLRDVAFWIWNDPVSEFRISKPVGSTGYHLATMWTPESRMGGFLDYNIRINQFSEQNRTPGEVANGFLKFITEVFPVLMPLMQQQGMTLDAEYIVKSLARYLNMDELGRSIIYVSGENLNQQGIRDDDFQMPNNTQRKYVRENRPAGTQQGMEQVLMRSLLSGSQGSEMDAALRPAM